MTIKEIRKMSIPLPTIKKWESNPDNQNDRECPMYVNKLPKKAVQVDFSQRAET